MEIRVLNKQEILLAKRVRLEKTILDIRKKDPVALAETLRNEFKINGDLVLSDMSFIALQEITECLKTKISDAESFE